MECPQVVMAADSWWNKDYGKILPSLQCTAPCHYIKLTWKESNNAESAHKWVNSYIFATTFTPTNHATPSCQKPGDTRLISCGTDSSLDDFTASPTEQCTDLYDALSVCKLISMRKCRLKIKNNSLIWSTEWHPHPSKETLIFTWQPEIKYLRDRYCHQQMERRERRDWPGKKAKGAKLKLLITYGQTSNENKCTVKWACA